MYIAKESFLGVNSEAGFYSLFEDFINKRSRVYVIKGGPGTGKSTLMRSIGKQAEQRGLEVEYLHCSSDPASLDGIFVKELGACMVDGTPPHVLEPPYPAPSGTSSTYTPSGTERSSRRGRRRSKSSTARSPRCSTAPTCT